MNKSKIFCVVGPSGVGKTTLIEEVCKLLDGKSIESYTTRPKRYKDEKGHIFVSEEEFDKLGEMAAFTVFNGYKYGVPEAVVDASDFYIIDIDGVKCLKKNYSNKPIRVIGITAPEDVLRARMSERGDSEAQINARLQHDKEAFAELDDICDIVISSSSKEADKESFLKALESLS